MEKNIILLTELGTPVWITAKLCNCTEARVEEVLDQQDQALEEAEEYYRTHEAERVRVSLKEMREEFPESERLEFRRKYLLEQLREARATQNKEKIQRVTTQIKIFTGRLERVSEQDIETARKYPLERILRPFKGMVRCPFHKDKTPSMDIRKNFYFCYSCNRSGDTIDLVMEMEQLSFPNAVKKILTLM